MSIEAVARGGQLSVERRLLSPEGQLEEALFTGLRLSDGLDLRRLKARYGVDVWARYGEELHRFVEYGLLIHDDRRLRLTRAGMLLAHEIMTVFIS